MKFDRTFTATLVLILGVIVSTGGHYVLSKEKPAQAPSRPGQMGIWLNTAGKWQGTVNFKMGEQTADGIINYEFRPFADSFGVSLEESINIPGIGTYRGLSLIGFDQVERRYHMYTVDNFGDVHDHPGNFTDDSTIAFEWKGPYGGKDVVESFTMRLGNEQMTFYLNRTSEGQVLDEYSAVLTRDNS